MNFCILLTLASTINFTLLKQDQALIIHNIKNFQLTHSEFISVVKKFNTKTYVTDLKGVLTNFDFKLHNRFIYDLVILIGSSSDKIIQVIEKLELVDFYD